MGRGIALSRGKRTRKMPIRYDTEFPMSRSEIGDDYGDDDHDAGQFDDDDPTFRPPIYQDGKYDLHSMSSEGSDSDDDDSVTGGFKAMSLDGGGSGSGNGEDSGDSDSGDSYESSFVSKGGSWAQESDETYQTESSVESEYTTSSEEDDADD